MTQLEADTYKQSRCWDYKMASKTKRKKWEEVKNLKKRTREGNLFYLMLWLVLNHQEILFSSIRAIYIFS